MKAKQLGTLRTVIVKAQTLASEVDDLEERRKLNRAINIMMTIIHPNFIPPGVEDDLEDLEA
jgi:hypothetical protein